jgi:Ca2+-dependent lipid-binding protein
MARTMVVNENLDPEWDEIVYVPVHNAKEKLVLEVMDYQVRNLHMAQYDVPTPTTD